MLVPLLPEPGTRHFEGVLGGLDESIVAFSLAEDEGFEEGAFGLREAALVEEALAVVLVGEVEVVGEVGVVAAEGNGLGKEGVGLLEAALPLVDVGEAQ